MVLATVHELQQTALLDALARRPGFGGEQLLLAFQVDEARALDAAGHATEAQLDHLVGQADRFEQLGATVRSHGGDAHLRQDLQQALGDALAVVLEDFVDVTQHFAGADQVGQHFIGQVRVHGGGAEAQQHAEVVRVTGGAGFHQDVAVAAQALLHQAVVHGADGQRSMRRQLARGDVAVAEDQQHLAGLDRRFGLVGEAAHGGFQTDRLVVVQLDDMPLEAGTIQLHDRPPLGRGDHRVAEDRAVGVFGGFLEDVALGTQAGFQRHDDGFAQRVDRRVGDLRKLLTEVVIRRTHAARQHGHRRVVAHRAHRLLALLGQRTQHLVTLLEGDLEHLHVALELLAAVLRAAVVVVVQGRLDAQGILTQPLLVGVARLQAAVDVVGVQHVAGVGIHGEDLPRTDPALGQHVLGLVVPDADFRGQGDVAILGGDPARRTQAVAVEQAHGVAAVGEHDAGRAVPGLHVHGVVFVEGAAIDVHGVDVLPGRRHQHAQATEQVHAAGHQQLKHVVHARGVGTDAVDQRAELLQVGDQLVGELQATRLRPVAVARDGVDFAVVGQEAERLGQRPLGQGVGREALVEHRDGGLQALVVEVRIEAGQVGRHHQTLVDQGLRREAAHVVVGVGGVAHRGAAAGAEQLHGEGGIRQALATDEHLLDLRQACQGQLTEHRGIHRHLAPADQFQARRLDLAVHVGTRRLGLHRVGIEKHHAHCVLARQLDIEFFTGHRAQEQVGLLNEQAATVAGLAVGVDAATVGHAGQRLDGGLEQVVTGLALHVGNQAEAAVVLERFGLVQTCFHREISPDGLRGRHIAFKINQLAHRPGTLDRGRDD